MNEISPLRIQRTSDAVDAEYLQNQPPEETHLRDYWKILVKRRRLAILVFLTVFAPSLYIISSATPMYTAKATITIEPQNPTFISVQEIQGLAVSQGDYYQTQFLLLKSRALAAKIIADQNLATNPAFLAPIFRPNPISWLSSKFFNSVQSSLDYMISLTKPSHLSSVAQSASPIKKHESASSSELTKIGAEPGRDEEIKPKVNPGNIGRYLSFVSVEPVRNTRLVNVRLTTPDPHLSQRLANAHAAAFIRMNLETRFQLNSAARQFLEKKLAELKAKVEEAEADLNAFRREHGVVSLEKGENIIVDRMLAINRSLVAARIKRIELESVRQMLGRANLDNLAEVVDNRIIQGYKGSLQAMEAEQIKLSTTLKPDHPRMIDLSKRITETRQRMKDAFAEVIHRIETDYESARNSENTLEAEAKRQRQTAIDLKGLGVKYGVLQGEVDSNRGLYNNVLARLNETNISNDLPVSNMHVTELADTPGGLITQGEQLSYLLASAGGALFLAIGLALGLAYFDSTLGTPQEIWRFVYLPTLGVVPDLHALQHKRGFHYLQAPKESLMGLLSHLVRGKKNLASKELIVSHHPLSMMSESYRSIRTALLFSQPEKPPQTILFTSPCPGEGKTVTALNLAVTLAQNGRSVLVIDADLRKGRCHTLLRRHNQRGLTNILTGNTSLDQSLQETDVKGLSLITRGAFAPNPPDLLGSRKMRELMDTLTDRFEFILLDTSPAIGVADAEVLATFCDGVVLVIHGQKTNKFSARQAVERLQVVRSNVLGVVLNGVDLSNPDYASYRHYYASYYASQNGGAENGGTDQLVESLPDPDDEREPAPEAEVLTVTVPKQFFEQMIVKLREAVGPMALIIVNEQIDRLGESLDCFPKSRLKELCDEVSEEILNEQLRDNFRRTMSDSVRAL